MDSAEHKKAARTVTDAFKVVERIYRHTYQTLTALAEELKTALELDFMSPQNPQSQSSTDPKSWIHQYRALYLSRNKFSLEDYKGRPRPIIFLQVSIYYNGSKQEPALRYGLINEISSFLEYKNPRFDDYFKKIMNELHAAPKTGKIATTHCTAKVDFEEIPLLNIRDDADIVALARIITDKHGKI